MMMGHDWGIGWGGMWFGWLMMIGFTVAVLVLIVWLVRLSAPAAYRRSTETAWISRRLRRSISCRHATHAAKSPRKSIWMHAQR